MTAHAACSPSSAAMWMNCPASVTQTKGITRPSSKYAREGSAAHAVAEMTLKGDIFLPNKVTVEGEEFIVSRGMCRAINPYINHIQNLTAVPGTRFVVEKRVVIPETLKLVWGTLDFGSVTEDYNIHLNVVDLKYGKGVAVEPDSPQLKLYGLGLAGLYGLKQREITVSLTVCQPRIGGTPLRSHLTTLGTLIDWRRDVVWPAITKINSGDTTENAGHWCRWCVRQTECKAFAGRHQKHAAAAFDD